jgi:hypothetical protein
MTQAPYTLARLSYSVAIGMVVIVCTWTWLQGPGVVGIALFVGTAVSGVLDDYLSSRAVAWGTPLAQGLVAGLTSWLTLRWLQS